MPQLSGTIVTSVTSHRLPDLQALDQEEDMHSPAQRGIIVFYLSRCFCSPSLSFTAHIPELQFGD